MPHFAKPYFFMYTKIPEPIHIDFGHIRKENEKNAYKYEKPIFARKSHCTLGCNLTKWSLAPI